MKYVILGLAFVGAVAVLSCVYILIDRVWVNHKIRCETIERHESWIKVLQMGGIAAKLDIAKIKGQLKALQEKAQKENKE